MVKRAFPNFLVFLLGIGLLSAACQRQEEEPTTVLLTIHFSAPIVSLDQISVTVSFIPLTGDATDLVELVPGSTTDLLSEDESPVTLLVYLPQSWADKTLIIGVKGLLDGEVVGHGKASLVPRRGEVGFRDITLQPGVPVCGNGFIEAAEHCEATDLGGQTCQSALGLGQGELVCTACHIDARDCYQCGNGAIEGREDCDANELGGLGCQDLEGRGFDGGQLACLEDCSFDLRGCNGGCGNDLADVGEDCDGPDLAGQTCLSAFGLASGELRCTANCRFASALCHVCGNGILEADEACDGAAFGGEDCASRGFGLGLLTCTADCRIDEAGCCGDGQKGLWEQCDGPDFGGQSCESVTGDLPAGELSCTALCTLDRTDCYDCGNGDIEGPEECDDGNNVNGDGCQGGCENPRCGDGIIDPGEVCDGTSLAGETCLSRGNRQGAGSQLGCNATCDGFDTSACVGGTISDETELRGAIAEAIAEATASGSHQVVGLPGGAYPVTSSIVVQECNPCVGAQPHGLTFQNLSVVSGVRLQPTGSFPVFDLRTGNNVIRGLGFEDAVMAIRLDSGLGGAGAAAAGGNRIEANQFQNLNVVPGVLLLVESAGNQLLSNRVLNELSSGPGTAAIEVSAPSNVVAMNVVNGAFVWALDIHDIAATLPPTYIDHNSLRITKGLGGGGLRLRAVDKLCYRNNIVAGDGTSTGLSLDTVGFGVSFECGGHRGENNVNRGHAVDCSDASGECATHCAGTGGFIWLCDLDIDPGFVDVDVCLRPLANSLIDAGLDLGYDLVDDSPLSFLGLRPDVGAREAGTLRSFGPSQTICD